MSSKVKVVCPDGHKFPVNLEKHTNRDHVFCPKCMAKVVVRKKHFFSPSPTWDEEKRERRISRGEMWSMKQKTTPVTPQQQQLFRAGGRSALFGLLAFSRLIKKREEEIKREQEGQSGRVQTEK